MRRRAARAGGLLFAAGVAAGPTAPADAAIVLAPGVTITLDCSTQSVVVAPTAATSNGIVRLALTPGEGTVAGTWTIVRVADTHSASFARAQETACKAGCELMTGAGGRLELWAPKRAAPGANGGASLTLAVLDMASLDLKASTFAGGDLSALETGTCTQATP